MIAPALPVLPFGLHEGPIQMQLLSVLRTVRDGKVRLSGMVRRGNAAEPTEVYFEFPGEWAEWVPESADPFAAALLIPAMMAREPLVLDPPISPMLLRNLPEIRSAFATWYPEMLASPITATPGAVRPAPIEPRAATFFSGGVDSFYTLFKRLGPDPLPEPLTHVIFMRGIETPLEEAKGTDASLAHIQAIASELGVSVISGETNIRTFFKRHWERYYFGSGLAATAAALSGGLSTVCIPSGRSYAYLHPEGSNPITDQMMSTEACRIVHDGSEANRAQKLEAAIRFAPDVVRANLRVCMMNDGGAFNCGACYKCVRTMVVLDILGELERHTLFRKVDRAAWERWMEADHHMFNCEALAFARRHAAPPATIRLLQSVVDRRERTDALIRLVKHSPLVRVLPVLRAIRDRLGMPARMHEL
jgi:hypothetical protein